MSENKKDNIVYNNTKSNIKVEGENRNNVEELNTSNSKNKILNNSDGVSNNVDNSNTKSDEKEKIKHRNKKIERFSNLSNEMKEKINVLRKKEEDLLDKSGYNKWKREFIFSYLSYSVITFLSLKFYAKIKQFNNIHLMLLFTPSFPLGLFLIKKNVDIPTYKEYYNTHIELNRIINIHINNKGY